jgi:hypothetical protein
MQLLSSLIFWYLSFADIALNKFPTIGNNISAKNNNIPTSVLTVRNDDENGIKNQTKMIGTIVNNGVNLAENLSEYSVSSLLKIDLIALIADVCGFFSPDNFAVILTSKTA